MRERPTVRLLLLSPSDRLLLMRFESEAIAESRVWWATAGGAVEPGEDLITAARRELLEETGIDDATWGPVVWTLDHVLTLYGQPVRMLESYILARTSHERLRRDGWTEEERRDVTDMRWWTHAEIVTCEELIVPRDLVMRLPALLAGEVPGAPIALTA